MSHSSCDRTYCAITVTAAVDKDTVAATRSSPSTSTTVDEVTVNVAGDEPLRQNRLRLLDKVRVSFLKLADFSQIEG